MLSNITILILSVMMPILGIFCFIKGYNIGAKETRKPEIKVESPRKAIARRKKESESEAKIRRQQLILQNIENYHGDSTGQKEIL